MMKQIFIVCYVALAWQGCSSGDTPTHEETPGALAFPDPELNLLALMGTASLQSFQWMNAPEEYHISGNALYVVSGKGTDFFNNPETGEVAASAPVLFREVQGDFVATALVKPDFSDIWNACALMVHIDSVNWVKFAFENSDATGKSIVSVVTRGVSDDANGVVLNERDSVWLRIIRKGDNYAMHWSTDGVQYHMARLSALPPSPVVKIGMEAQCPAGDPATHAFLYFSLEQRTVADMRKGK